MDETKKKIMDATMNLIMERGYTLTTTKDIAKQAGINECTIFRRFKGKKEIVLEAMKETRWNPSLSEADFKETGNIREDLIQFAMIYMSRVTPQMVKLSIGLRTPEMVTDTTPEILKIPMVFKSVLTRYFDEKLSTGQIGMAWEKKEMTIEHQMDAESMAMQFLSMNVGFVFLKASFAEMLTKIVEKQFILDSVDTFLHGIL